MRSHRVPAALIGAIVFSLGPAACGVADEPTTAVGLELSTARGANHALPCSGRCETSFAPPTLPPPPVIRQVDEGECQLSGLGRTSAHIVQDIDIGAGTQRSVEITFTAANGDILRAATAGTNTVTGSGVAFQATMTFTGGTGRFANATGEASVVGSANFHANTASFAVDGVIAYGSSPHEKN